MAVAGRGTTAPTAAVSAISRDLELLAAILGRLCSVIASERTGSRMVRVAADPGGDVVLRSLPDLSLTVDRGGRHE